MLDLCAWLWERTRRPESRAGGRHGAQLRRQHAIVRRQSPFTQLWPQPAAGDSGYGPGGCADGPAEAGGSIEPMTGADLGRGFSDAAIEAVLRIARVPYERPDDLPDAVAEIIAGNGIVAWFAGRAEYGPRALGYRSLLAHPSRADNVGRLNNIKGREQFRRSRRWSWPSGPARSSPEVRCPARTCCSCTTSRRIGATGCRQSPT